MRRRVAVGRRGPGLLGTMARTALVAGTATAVARGVRDAQTRRVNEQAVMSDLAVQQQRLQAQQEILAEQQRLAMLRQERTPAPPAARPTGAGGLTQETMALLQQLGEMQQQSILTPDEFAKQKAKILGS